MSTKLSLGPGKQVQIYYKDFTQETYFNAKLFQTGEPNSDYFQITDENDKIVFINSFNIAKIEIS